MSKQLKCIDDVFMDAHESECFSVNVDKAVADLRNDLMPMIRRLTGSVQDCTKRVMSNKPYRKAAKDEDNAAKAIAHYLGVGDRWKELLDD